METVGGLGMLFYTGSDREPRCSGTSRSSSSTGRRARTEAGPTAACSPASPTRGSRSGTGPPSTRYTWGDQDFEGVHCSRQGSAATQLAWVAINCGHELQVNDDPGGGEPQKTGSVYNFRPNTISQARPGPPRAEWTNYEVRVEGQQSHPSCARARSSTRSTTRSRATRPAAATRRPQARQFAEGYIGLQNRGSTDRVRYRNVRVTDLAPGARAGGEPFHGQRPRDPIRSSSARSTGPGTSRTSGPRRSGSAGPRCRRRRRRRS